MQLLQEGGHIDTVSQLAVISRDISVAGGTSLQSRDMSGTVRKSCTSRRFAAFSRRRAKSPHVRHVPVTGMAVVETDNLPATLTCCQWKVDCRWFLCSSQVTFHAMRKAKQNKRRSLCVHSSGSYWTGPSKDALGWTGA